MSTATTNVDHRTRVAAERRQRTRDKLVEHALLVYAEHGAGSSMIQEVIASASVAQGTFYNYFRTHHELLVAVSEQLSNDLLRVIEREVASCKLVDKRLAKGLLLFLRTARDHPVLAHFASHGGLHAAGTRVDDSRELVLETFANVAGVVHRFRFTWRYQGGAQQGFPVQMKQLPQTVVVWHP